MESDMESDMEIQVCDGRGKNMTALASENRKKVIKFYNENKGATISECQRALNLSYPTVRRNLDEILGKKKCGSK
jgi:hypothetical protein